MNKSPFVVRWIPDPFQRNYNKGRWYVCNRNVEDKHGFSKPLDNLSSFPPKSEEHADEVCAWLNKIWNMTADDLKSECS